MGIETAIGLGLGAAGTGASIGGGKKGRKAAKRQAEQQLALQKEMLGLARQGFEMGRSAWQPAANYWQALLQGGQPARVAVGPMAAEVREAGGAARRGIEENLPRGGQRDLALAQSQIAQHRDVSRLYTGVQPQAAGALGQLAGIPFGVGTSMSGQAGITGANLLSNLYGRLAQNQQNAMQGAEGFGRLMYKIWQNRPQGAQSVVSGVPTGPSIPLPTPPAGYFG